MKFVKAITVVLLLCAAVLLMIGVFVPEIDDEIEMHINAPIVGVFAGMMNTSDLPKWVDGLESVERTSGILAMPGSTFELHFKDKETEVVYTMEILEIVPLQSIRYRLYNDMLDVEINTNMKVDGLSTDLDVFVQVKGKGLFVKSFLPLLKSVVMDEIRGDFEAYKQLQEQ